MQISHNELMRYCRIKLSYFICIQLAKLFLNLVYNGCHYIDLSVCIANKKICRLVYMYQLIDRLLPLYGQFGCHRFGHLVKMGWIKQPKQLAGWNQRLSRLMAIPFFLFNVLILLQSTSLSLFLFDTLRPTDRPSTTL